MKGLVGGGDQVGPACAHTAGHIERTHQTELGDDPLPLAHPGDGGGSGSRYRFADTGLDAGTLRERAAAYQQRYDVPSEAVR